MNKKLRAAIADVLIDTGMNREWCWQLSDMVENRISREFCVFSHVWIYDENDKRFCEDCGVAKEEA